MRFYSKCNREALKEFKAGKGYHLIYIFKGLLRLLCRGTDYAGARMEEVRRAARKPWWSSRSRKWHLSPGWQRWGWRDSDVSVYRASPCPDLPPGTPASWNPCLPNLSTWMLNTHLKLCLNLDSWSVTCKPAVPQLRFSPSPPQLLACPPAYIQTWINIADSIFKICLELNYVSPSSLLVPRSKPSSPLTWFITIVS